jgi:hypothetical protein
MEQNGLEVGPKQEALNSNPTKKKKGEVIQEALASLMAG